MDDIMEAYIIPISSLARVLIMLVWSVWWTVYQVGSFVILLPAYFVYSWIRVIITVPIIKFYEYFVHGFLYQCIAQPIYYSIIHPITVADTELFYFAAGLHIQRIIASVNRSILQFRVILLFVYLNQISPIVEAVLFAVSWIYNLPDEILQYVRHICFVVTPLVTYMIGVESDTAQAMSNAIFNYLDWIIQSVNTVNRFMYEFIFFPISLPDGVPAWKHGVYYLFSVVHVFSLLVLWGLQLTVISITVKP
ncbi:hypothetical protein [Parasitella parasitica]|uniref:Uncharacterized protein n=1 Tax=Parasitella parasitica TaxID=35722 RepID=A0A0B7MLZ6_9FUNG|nr:hypothetical protein [Parasitella parasitica]